ncbi:hypothetical protein [Indioceanicola profundi]|uniref:hypothetical protein n=1 Tax=Indioceanicola profundi TaxID=2220096 RepID=UPI0013C4EAD5|nr:hypothetical protein [Indioceanicola profundi]
MADRNEQGGKDSEKTLGQQQGDLPEDAGTTRPGGAGIGQPGEKKPDRPAIQGVDHPKPNQT